MHCWNRRLWLAPLLLQCIGCGGGDSARSGVIDVLPTFVPLVEGYAKQGDIAQVQAGDMVVESFSSVLPVSQSLLVVGDHRGRRLFAFSTTGSPLWRAGQSGEGPGDLSGVRSIVPSGSGSLFVHDDRLRRVSEFSNSGEFMRSIDIRDADVGLRPAALLGTGLKGELWFRLYGIAPRPGESPGIDTVSDYLARLDGGGQLLVQDSLAARVYATASLGSTELVLGPQLHVALSGDRLISYWTGADQIVVQRLGSPAQVDSTTTPQPSRTPTVEEVRIARELVRPRPFRPPGVSATDRVNIEAMNRARDAIFEAVPAAPTIGYFDGLLADGNGGAWFRVRNAIVSPTDSTERWLKLTPEMRWTKGLLLPPHSRLKAVANGQVVLERSDDDGVPTLEVWMKRPK